MSYLVLGNIFSLLSALCIAVSVIKQSKKDFMFWQMGDTFWGILTNIALNARAALVISIVCLIRNVLSYRNILSKKITYILVILSIIIGLYANNWGIIGYLPIIASVGFTICIYLTKNEQQMRYALLINMLLWFAHNLCVQAYPSAVANIALFLWTSIQIIRYRKSI